MLFSISPQPPFHKYRFKNDTHIRIMPSIGMIFPNEKQLILVAGGDNQFNIDVFLEVINYNEEYLDILENSKPQLWIEKQPGELNTQIISIRMNIYSDYSTKFQQTFRQFQGQIASILQDESRLSAIMSQKPNQLFQDRMDPEQSYNYISGNFQWNDDQKTNSEVSGILSQTSIMQANQNYQFLT